MLLIPYLDILHGFWISEKILSQPGSNSALVIVAPRSDHHAIIRPKPIDYKHMWPCSRNQTHELWCRKTAQYQLGHRPVDDRIIKLTKT